MSFTPMLKKVISSLLCCYSLVSLNSAQATIVEFQTSQGNFQVNLFDQTTPITVNNFLNYVNEQSYTNSLIHRAVPGFVVQGGGFEFTGDWPLSSLASNGAIDNEPVYSNVKGTIAMAKLGGIVNSASNQWFFNLQDNSNNLDTQNGGFTVFGQVIGDGMAVLEKISALQLCDNSGLDDIPMLDYTSQECTDKAVPGLENFVVVEQITIVDSSEVTDADLTKIENTLIDQVTPPTQPEPSSGGGAMYWLLALLSLPLLRKK